MTFFRAVVVIAFLGIARQAAGVAVDTVCVAAAATCGTDKGFYCDITGGTLQCKCAKIYTGAAAATSCSDTTCTADATCTALDASSYCSSGKCACKPGFEVTNADFTGARGCTAITIGSTCKSGDCDSITGAYCDATTSKCACGALYTGAAGAATCTQTACTYATTDTACTAKDSNSRCLLEKCDCLAGYDILGTSKLCQSAGVGGLVTSASLLVTGLVLTIFM